MIYKKKEKKKDFDDVAIRTFKVGLPTKHDLRKSLTKKPIRSVCWLMDRIDEYKQVEEYQQQRKWKAKVIPQDRKDFKLDRYNNNRPQRDFDGNQGQVLHRWLAQCLGNQCIKSWKRLTMNHTLNGQIKWKESL